MQHARTNTLTVASRQPHTPFLRVTVRKLAPLLLPLLSILSSPTSASTRLPAGRTWKTEANAIRLEAIALRNKEKRSSPTTAPRCATAREPRSPRFPRQPLCDRSDTSATSSSRLRSSGLPKKMLMALAWRRRSRVWSGMEWWKCGKGRARESERERESVCVCVCGDFVGNPAHVFDLRFCDVPKTTAAIWQALQPSPTKSVGPTETTSNPFRSSPSS